MYFGLFICFILKCFVAKMAFRLPETSNQYYGERPIPCHPPKSVVRGKTRVPDTIPRNKKGYLKFIQAACDVHSAN